MTKAQKALDKHIEQMFYRRCSGIAIDIMDIGKVFEAGRRAAREDDDIENAIVSTVNALRKN